MSRHDPLVTLRHLIVLLALCSAAWGVEFSTVEIAGKRVTV